MNGLLVPLIIVAAYAVFISVMWIKAKKQVSQATQTDQSDKADTATLVVSASQNSGSPKKVYSSDEYHIKADEAMRLSNTFQKFVPKQFVEHFAKHGNTELGLGTADEDNVAILFCDIRGFTSFSERMSPQELMKFLNSYFLRMNAPIHTNHGFIDKFIGDAIMALFDRPQGTDQDKAQDAIKAAIGLQTALVLYNSHRAKCGYSPINIGIGIHFGHVILGTVGSDDRMDTTVIGDSVNIAERLESLAPLYQVDIIVSRKLIETALDDAAEPQDQTKFNYRIIDWVRVRGRNKPIELVEVIAHLPDEQIQQKKATQDLLLKVIELRKKHEFGKALAILELAESDDSVILHHMDALTKLMRDPPSLEWDGALDV